MGKQYLSRSRKQGSSSAANADNSTANKNHGFTDNRPVAVVQRSLQEMADQFSKNTSAQFGEAAQAGSGAVVQCFNPNRLINLGEDCRAIFPNALSALPESIDAFSFAAMRWQEYLRNPPQPEDRAEATNFFLQASTYLGEIRRLLRGMFREGAAPNQYTVPLLDLLDQIEEELKLDLESADDALDYHRNRSAIITAELIFNRMGMRRDVKPPIRKELPGYDLIKNRRDPQ